MTARKRRCLHTLQPKIDGIATTCPRHNEARARLPRSRAFRCGRRRIRAPHESACEVHISGPRLREGSEYLSVARTIRGEDITAFAELSGDFSPLHTDDEWVRKNTPFSSRIAWRHDLQHLPRAAYAGHRRHRLPGFRVHPGRPRLPRPSGDTIAARSTVSQVRRSRSSPACGIACLQVAVINQDGTIVQRGSDTYLAAARPADVGQNTDDWPTAWPGRRFPDVTERRGP